MCIAKFEMSQFESYGQVNYSNDISRNPPNIEQKEVNVKNKINNNKSKSMLYDRLKNACTKQFRKQMVDQGQSTNE